MSWFSALLSNEEREADSLIVAGLLAMLVLLGLSVYVTVLSPASFSPIASATGIATVLGGMAGARKLRDFRKDDTP